LHSICKLTARGLLLISLAGFAGCATTAEMESLRAEVARANATAASAAADAARTRRELAALKAAGAPREPYSGLLERPSAPLDKAKGYKWGCPCMPSVE